MTAPDARQIYQDHLDRLSRAAFDGDFETLLAHVAIPAHIVTAAGDAVITSAAELEFVMLDYIRSLARAGVVKEREWCIEARLMPGATDMITGTHFTEWHYADDRPPHRYTGRLVLIRLDDSWKVMTLHANIDSTDFEVFSPEFVAAQATMLGQLGARQ